MGLSCIIRHSHCHKFHICYLELKKRGPLFSTPTSWLQLREVTKNICPVLHRQVNNLNRNYVMLTFSWGGAAWKLNNCCNISPKIMRYGQKWRTPLKRCDVKNKMKNPQTSKSHSSKSECILEQFNKARVQYIFTYFNYHQS